MSGAAEASAARRCDIFRGYQVQPYLEPHTDFFDRAAVPPEISELLDEWPTIDPTARLIRAAVMSRKPRRMRRAWQLLAARADLMQMLQASGR